MKKWRKKNGHSPGGNKQTSSKTEEDSGGHLVSPNWYLYEAGRAVQTALVVMRITITDTHGAVPPRTRAQSGRVSATSAYLKLNNDFTVNDTRL